MARFSPHAVVSLGSRTLNLPARSGLDGGELRYRFGFVLNTTIGKLTRFDNLRKYAARDLDVRCSWTPMTHLLSVGAASALRGLPGTARGGQVIESGGIDR
jgi:hypothetical protein